jgi:phage shock protein C
MTVRGPAPYVQRRLVRSVTGKKLAGVCAGLAEYLDADPVMMRLIWVMITLGLPPAGIIGYIVAWIVIPKAPSVPVALTPEPVVQS